MIKIEHAEVLGWEHAIRGMRNPMNSWEKSDSGSCIDVVGDIYIGPKDLDLMLKLSESGTDHAKFRRMITVYVDLTAPLYWWKEFDTYKVGTVANSCSTMHKIAEKEFTLDDFSHEHLLGRGCIPDHAYQNPHDILALTIDCLNYWREKYLELSKIDEEAWKAAPKANGLTNESLTTAKKNCWWQIIQLLPSSYNQKRTVMLNYEVLANIYKSRKDHKLDEWREFCAWIETLPYSEIITRKEN